MDTGKLKNFAQSARRQLLAEVSTRLDQVLEADSVETREKKTAITELKQQISQSSKVEVIDRVAYTWFNRFCALRYMDVNHYTRIGMVSPQEGYTQPEILQEAKQGVIDPELKVDRQQVLDILSGKIPSQDQQAEIYQLLLVGACNYYNQLMPFLFEPIADFTELLMPIDLLSENSILYNMREVLTPETCQDVEVIGWLYQFYISERKDEVFENLKKNIKIEAKDIPAATQLFTPHWIVRYLVENSLGRLWMLNNPESRLIEQMEYYIKPEQEETDFLKIGSPEELKVCDPACGSGHMLTYAFDLFYTIYEEQGFDSTQIPSLILQNNLYGIEIDKRAGDLAAFTLVMKARARDKRFLSRKVEPNICVLHNIVFSANEVDEYMKVVGNDLFTRDLWATLKQFEHADNFGSLIKPQLKYVVNLRNRLEEKKVFENLFLHNTNQKLQQVLQQVEYLSPRYHVVIANPPYMGGKGMNDQLKQFLEDNYADAKADLFSAFIIRNFDLALYNSRLGFVTPFVWLFLASYENIRILLLSKKTICNLVKPSYTSFFASAIVSLVAFVVKNSFEDIKADYFDLGYLGSAESQPIKFKEAIQNEKSDFRYRVKSSDFKKIPGFPIAYWASNKVRNIFTRGTSLGDMATIKVGMHTGSNDLFVRNWYEVSYSNIGFKCLDEKDTENLPYKWYPYNKGGNYRKWYGNRENVVNWYKRGIDIHNFHKIPLEHNGAPVRAKQYQFKQSLSWSFISSNFFGVRYSPPGSMFDVGGSSVFPKANDIFWLAGLLCSKLSTIFMQVVNSTVNYQVGNVATIPIIAPKDKLASDLSQSIINISKIDWDNYETSSEFKNIPLLISDHQNNKIESTYQDTRKYWNNLLSKIIDLEQENNRIFIEIYGLEDEMTPDVSLPEITLTCNPHYRYSGNKNDEELEVLLQADTIKEFISYSIGCMFGRYSLDKPGLILANQGEGTQDYYKQVPHTQFPPDEDNIIPILDEGWFNDDITERFKMFMRVTYGDEHYEENLAFIENAIGRDIRSYFLKDFYNEHVQMYKKRPIYWLFSSASGSFNALIYMHRYQPDTVSVILNDYLREFIRKLNAHKAHLEEVSSRFGGSQAEKTKATKEINELNKVLAELKEYEDEVIYPLATQQIQIDLDDGVKVNYKKFGNALMRINGLSE